ncbi:MAG: hypothetical protein WBK51_09045 [Polaromonas sp.]
MLGVLGCTLLFVGLTARVLIVRAAAASAVDQHYWFLAARAYREQRTLPVRICDKYLLEDEEQGYPPLFGMILGRITGKSTGKFLTHALELIEFAALGVLLFALGLPRDMALVALGFYATAPVLVVYNAQLTPRILGDLFLFAAMALQLVAVFKTIPVEVQWLCWGASAFLLALMVMTHKMTLQLHLVLLPFWWWALGAWQIPFVTVAGFALYTLFVGVGFAKYQFRAHWDIVTFWNRHWRDLGAHQFGHSPLYGDASADRSVCFHQAGWRGVAKHLRVVVSYAPFALVLPVGSLVSGVWPPSWVLVWLGGVYAWALLTLFVAPLKCLGGGHLYVFNAIVPASLYVAYLPQTLMVGFWLTAGALLTVVSLVMAWRIIRTRSVATGDDFKEVIRYISALPKANLAVFPLQSAEPVAARTHHAVLWGGHGYGFGNMEDFFPVLTRPLETFFTRHFVNWVLWNSRFWPEGETRLISEGLIEKSAVQRFGNWCLAPRS